MSDEIGRYNYAYTGMTPPWPMPQPQPQPQQSNMDLASMLIPVLVTLPALKSAKVNFATIQQNLSNLPIPADILGNPTAADYNALKNAVAGVRQNLQNAVNNDQAAFSAMSQGLIFSLIIPAFSNNQAGGSNGIMLLVLLLALNGGLGF